MINIVYYATYEKHVDCFMRRMVEKLSEISIKYKFYRDREMIQTEKFVIFGISFLSIKGWLPKIDYVVLEDNYNNLIWSNNFNVFSMAHNHGTLMMKCDENYKEITVADLYGLIGEWS